MREIVVIAHNIRSSHNIGSLLRTADGLGVQRVYFTGYSPYPTQKHDSRLPHIANKLHTQISKTALGAENTQAWEHHPNIEALLADLRTKHYEIVALEQTPHAIPLPEFKPSEKIALVLGSEVEGITPELLRLTDTHIVIPMFGKKESFNVIQAAAIALYHVRFSS